MSSQPQPLQPNDRPGPEVSPDGALNGAFDAALECCLLEDGARWRADTAPPLAPFALRVNAALRERRIAPEKSGDGAERPREENPMAHRRVTHPPRAATQIPGRHRPGALSTLVAVAAVVAVVATLAAVLHTLPHGRVAAPTATPTPDFAAHVTHARGHWADVAQYTAGPDSAIFVAPSNARIAFRIIMSPADPTAVALARTSDGGVTWTTLTLPTDDGGWFGGLAFSPLDAQTIFLTLDSDQHNPHCPTYALGYGAAVGPTTQPVQHVGRQLGLQYPASGGYSCSFQYVSRDGGGHWAHPSFPWQAQHFAQVGYWTGSFPGQAQGTTLFAAVTGNLNGEYFDGVRLVASEDGGSTWSAVDTTIYAAGQVVTSYSAIAGTTSLYAISVPQQTPAGHEKGAALWSSVDAGAHWTRVGPAPLVQAQLMGTTGTPGGSTLYAVGLQPNSPDGKVPVVASRDGGRTWAPVTSAGWPPGQLADPWSLNTLSDGSLLVEFTDPPTPSTSGMETVNAIASFYGWRPGDTAWFPVTPRPGGGSAFEAWLTSPAHGPQTLWMVVASPSKQGTTFTVRQCVLQ